MIDLLKKYKHNVLTPDELLLLRKQTEAMNDKKLEELLLADWLRTEEDMPLDNSVDFERIRKSVEHKIEPSKRISLVYMFLRYAAMLLLPLLLFSTFYFYRQAEIVAEQEMVIQAGKGERANITLPDGTLVKINVESTLRYNPAEFNKSSRKIDLDGEAFFEVKKNEKIPFIISSQNLNLKVLGTTFNFRSRENEEKIEVTLLEGHVLLSSATHAKKTQELVANEKAIFYKNTGEFLVEKEEKTEKIPWIQKKLYFKNALFMDLIKTIEQEYSVHFELLGCERFYDDSFSGTLPSTDLETVMDILRKSYGFEYSVNSDEIQVRCE